MLLKVFSIYDSKAAVYTKPFFSRTTNEALRDWKAVVGDPKAPYSMFPEDFCLFELGTYDQATAKFELLAVPHSLGLAIEFISKAPPTEPMFDQLKSV